MRLLNLIFVIFCCFGYSTSYAKNVIVTKNYCKKARTLYRNAKVFLDKARDRAESGLKFSPKEERYWTQKVITTRYIINYPIIILLSCQHPEIRFLIKTMPSPKLKTKINFIKAVFAKFGGGDIVLRFKKTRNYQDLKNYLRSLGFDKIKEVVI